MQSAASNRLHHIPGLQLGRLQHAATFTSSPCELARGGRGRGELEARERGRLLEAAALGLGARGCSLLPGWFCTTVRLGAVAHSLLGGALGTRSPREAPRGVSWRAFGRLPVGEQEPDLSSTDKQRQENPKVCLAACRSVFFL